MIPAIRKQKILNLLQSGEILYTDYLLDTLGVSLHPAQGFKRAGKRKKNIPSTRRRRADY